MKRPEGAAAMNLLVRILAPTGRDAELVRSVLEQGGVRAEIWSGEGAGVTEGLLGPLLLAEEALGPGLVGELTAVLRDQPTWSDLPIVILTSGGRMSARVAAVVAGLGAPILLERPIRTESLLSSVRAAVRARQRQYEVRDVLHERDRAVAALEQERRTLETVLKNLPVGVLVADAAGRVVLGNRMVEQMFRHPVLPSADFEAHGEWASFHADGRRVKGTEYPLPRAIRTGRPVEAEDYLYQRGDGTLAWVSLAAAPLFDAEGRVSGGVVAISDVDGQKRSAEELRRSGERFRRLIENARVGVLIGDLEGGISYANPTMLRLLGYTAEEMASGVIRWDALTPAEYAPMDQRAVEQLRLTGTAEPYRKAYRAKDGRLVPLLLGATVIPAPEGSERTDEVAVFLTDLSSQRQAEAALIQAEKLAAVGRLAASISHEINNPLEAVTNTLYLLGQEALSEEGREYLRMAESELARVSQIAVQTLRFHRQSTRARRLLPEDLVGPVLGLYHGRLENSGVRVEEQQRAAEPVECYEGEVRQVLSNLVSNAIDAMRTGGRLVIRTGDARRWRDGEAGVRVTIADTGSGMSAEVMRHIFEAFYTTKGINGTGLGLWISREIVAKHGGELRVRSSSREGGAGTVFRLFLPRTPSPEAELA